MKFGSRIKTTDQADILLGQQKRFGTFVSETYEQFTEQEGVLRVLWDNYHEPSFIHESLIERDLLVEGI